MMPTPDKNTALHGGNFPNELLRLLGLPKMTQSFTLHCAHDKLAEIEVTHVPEVDINGIKSWAEAQTERYHLMKVGQFDLAAHLTRQRAFSLATFGPSYATAQLCDHIGKELVEIRDSAGADLMEWVDVIILALDGALRTGATPHQVIEAIVAKQTKNEGRTWPDWRTAPADKAMEHDRSKDVNEGARP